MLSNYIKLAWRILGRKKFFTFISLFGISFTLGIFMVNLSFLQGELGTNAPLGNKDDFVLISSMRLQRVFYDTVTVVDTVMENGIALYDTTYQFNRNGTMQWNSSMNNGIAENYLSDLSSVKDRTILSTDTHYDVYVNNVKLSLKAMHCDPNYWNIFNHKIISGRVFDQTDMDQAAKVVVISTKTADDYFGTQNDVVGKEMEIDGDHYQVIGMYQDNSKIIPYVSPDLAIPYSLLALDDQDSFYHGYFQVVLQRKPEATIEEVKAEVLHAASLVPLDHPSKPDGYNEVILRTKTYNEMFAQGVYYDDDATKSYTVMKWVLLGLLTFFIVLPTLNLINLNVSRILERSSEIGVRKAFGAHQSNIIAQFVIENIVQTILGGIIGFLLAVVLINFINNSGFLGSSTMVLNANFFLYSFIITLLFGIISGILPAYRISKLSIVDALKNTKL